MNLVARPIGADDYQVLEDGEPVGRIRHAAEEPSRRWVWNVQILVPMPPWANGIADSREEAMASFRAAFARLKGDIGPEAYARAIGEARFARERFAGPR